MFVIPTSLFSPLTQTRKKEKKKKKNTARKVPKKKWNQRRDPIGGKLKGMSLFSNESGARNESLRLLFSFRVRFLIINGERRAVSYHLMQVETGVGDIPLLVPIRIAIQAWLLATDLGISNHGQVTQTTPELETLSPNYHTTPHGRTFDLTCIARYMVGLLRYKARTHGSPAMSPLP
ncbi:hypothetical protein TNCV_3360031 [Trichonephila clavipes]|nr:hypothetical protein TNCV_3360031 [Trichonephila clavipes]